MRFDEINLEKAILQKIILPGKNDLPEIFMLRLDLIHPAVHGNKYFKMKYNLLEAVEKGFDTLLTFGGAYSNHIHATSAAGRIFGFKTIGIIRGEEHLPLNPTLQFAVNNGMELEYVTRSDYRTKHTSNYHDRLRDKFGNVFIIPEGGTNLNAVKGCSEIPSIIKKDFNYLCVACGTAGTLSGIVAGLNGNKNVLGFSVLKGGAFLKTSAEKLIFDFCDMNFFNWDIDLDYHFGGYAKINFELLNFIDQFEKLNGIKLDPVYTGKMMFGVSDLIRKGFFKSEDTIVAIHTGGQQGTEGMKTKIESVVKINSRKD